MKKLTKAFTLAEVLIALAVIGIIASITLPTLNINIQRHIAETSLVKAINTLSNANKMILEEQGTRTLIRLDNNNRVPSAVYIRLLAEATGSTFEDRSPGGLRVLFPRIVTKDGIVFQSNGIIGWRRSDNPDLPTRFISNDYFWITVDVNGSKNPNTIGKDQFQVYIENRGNVYVRGSNDARNYLGNNETWRNGNCDSNSVNAPETCGGSIVDNNFKIIYNYNFAQ